MLVISLYQVYPMVCPYNPTRSRSLPIDHHEIQYLLDPTASEYCLLNPHMFNDWFHFSYSCLMYNSNAFTISSHFRRSKPPTDPNMASEKTPRLRTPEFMRHWGNHTFQDRSDRSDRKSRSNRNDTYSAKLNSVSKCKWSGLVMVFSREK